jgi:hypothetical protein
MRGSGIGAVARLGHVPFSFGSGAALEDMSSGTNAD